MSNLNRIKQLHKVCERALFQTDTTLDYVRALQAVALLAEWVEEYDGEGEDLWHLDGLGLADIGSLFVGSYWYTVHWQSADQVDLMAMQFHVGSVFSPGMTDGPEPDSCEQDVYEQWEQLRGDD